MCFQWFRRVMRVSFKPPSTDALTPLYIMARVAYPCLEISYLLWESLQGSGCLSVNAAQLPCVTRVGSTEVDDETRGIWSNLHDSQFLTQPFQQPILPRTFLSLKSFSQKQFPTRCLPILLSENPVQLLDLSFHCFLLWEQMMSLCLEIYDSPLHLIKGTLTPRKFIADLRESLMRFFLEFGFCSLLRSRSSWGQIPVLMSCIPESISVSWSLSSCMLLHIKPPLASKIGPFGPKSTIFGSKTCFCIFGTPKM